VFNRIDATDEGAVNKMYYVLGMNVAVALHIRN